MRRIISVAFLILALLLEGCVRTYRAEQHSHFDSAVNFDGSVCADSHSEAAEREWMSVWPFGPSKIVP